MKIDLQQIINNPFAVNLAFSLGRGIPPQIGKYNFAVPHSQAVGTG
jgi:hypothetical protein